MSHRAQREFFESVRGRFPGFFCDVRVLEVGSLDINGSVRGLFRDPYWYTGIDLGPGKNVDVVCPGHLFDSGFRFDTVVSSETLEHDMHYQRTLRNMVRLLKGGGLMIFSCASTGRIEHGTVRSRPEDAPLLMQMGNEWSRYYQNLTEVDIRRVLKVEELFAEFEFQYEPEACDLYFWGVKRSDV